MLNGHEPVLRVVQEHLVVGKRLAQFLHVADKTAGTIKLFLNITLAVTRELHFNVNDHDRIALFGHDDKIATLALTMVSPKDSLQNKILIEAYHDRALGHSENSRF
jgi:hypothetical protein